MVAGLTARLAESNSSLPPGLWLTSPVGWLPRTGISSGTLRFVVEYGLPLLFNQVVTLADARFQWTPRVTGSIWSVHVLSTSSITLVSQMKCDVMSMWSLTNESVTWAPYSIKSYSLSHSWTLWWRVRWLKQCCLEIEAELQQRWRRTNRRRKSIPRSSSSHREGPITQRGASCGRYGYTIKVTYSVVAARLPYGAVRLG